MPATQIISYSEIDAFRQCPFKHQLAYVERWTKGKTGGALARGSLWHSVLEAHYRVIMAHQQAHPGHYRGAGLYPGQISELKSECQAAVSLVLAQALDEGIEPEEVAIVEWMYEGHVAVYSIDEEWEILAVEHPIQMPLYDPATGRKTKFRVKGKIDLIVRLRLNQKVAFVDHKSGAALPSQRDLDFDDQFGLYQALMRHVGRSVFSSIYSAARTKKNKVKETPLEDRFTRTWLTRTPRELDTIESETLDTARSMYSARNRAERHPNSDTCKWRCDYVEPCLLGRKTTNDRTRVFLIDTGFQQDYTRH